ncbi:hypothetical protein AVEN_261279-1 [Araneus ventricosus]|uniref:Uncharacterized protein n=1 Tax=Araneus ventricosus TaxID=182803 RepID=A0A4Y2GIS3_ARAVE|nr:hypothetical protein AVEN_261279-1 [Araneus ventricosus]
MQNGTEIDVSEICIGICVNMEHSAATGMIQGGNKRYRMDWVKWTFPMVTTIARFIWPGFLFVEDLQNYWMGYNAAFISATDLVTRINITAANRRTFSKMFFNSCSASVKGCKTTSIKIEITTTSVKIENCFYL